VLDGGQGGVASQLTARKVHQSARDVSPANGAGAACIEGREKPTEDRVSANGIWHRRADGHDVVRPNNDDLTAIGDRA
jgi:hypothetical protein